jgi:hypothetical protein
MTKNNHLLLKLDEEFQFLVSVNMIILQYPPELSVRAREPYEKTRFSKRSHSVVSRPIDFKFAGNVEIEGSY